MKLLEILFYMWVVMSAVYVVFNIKDFAMTWGAWLVIVPKRLWELVNKWILKK